MFFQEARGLSSNFWFGKYANKTKIAKKNQCITLRVRIAKFILAIALLVWFLFWIFRVENVQFYRPLSPGRTTVTSPYFPPDFLLPQIIFRGLGDAGRAHEFRWVWDSTSINCALILDLRDRTPSRQLQQWFPTFSERQRRMQAPARLGPAKIPVCCRPQENRSSKMRSNFAKSGAWSGKIWPAWSVGRLRTTL